MFDRHLLVIIFGVLCILCSLRNEEWQRNIKYRKITCIILCIVFIIQNGFRDYLHSVNDTYNYYHAYLAIEGDSIIDMIKSASFIASNYESRDPGYDIFVRLTQYISTDFGFFLCVIATIINIPLFRIIYKNATSLPGIFIAATLYAALFESFFETGIRQTLCMGLVYVALDLYQHGKIKSCVILNILAYTIHTTAIVFFPLYLLLLFKRQNWMLGISLLVAPVFMYFAKPIIAFIGRDTIFEEYAIDSTDNLGTPVFTTLVFVAVIATKLLANSIEKIHPNYALLFSTLIMALMLTPASWVDSNFIRITFYYLVFLMPMMSVIVDASSKQNRALQTFLYSALAIILMVL